MYKLINIENENNNFYKIKKIAGNNDFILVSIIGSSFDGNNILYQKQLSTNSLKTRYLLKIPINNFDIYLKDLYINENIKIEHIFDF